MDYNWQTAPYNGIINVCKWENAFALKYLLLTSKWLYNHTTTRTVFLLKIISLRNIIPVRRLLGSVNSFGSSDDQNSRAMQNKQRN